MNYAHVHRTNRNSSVSCQHTKCQPSATEYGGVFLAWLTMRTVQLQ